LSFNENKQAGTTASVSIASVQPLYQRSQDVAGTPVKDVEAPGGKMPKLLGKITVHQRDTIYWVFRRVYEDFNLTERQIQEVRDANPHIKNLDIIRAGEMVNIPAIPVMSNPLPTGEGHFRVQIARSSNLDEAHKILVNHPDGLPPVRLFSYWNGREGAVFTVLLKRDFADEASARDAIKRLPPSIAANASVMNDWDKDTIFFAFR
jgi:phage tail protein X